MKEVTTKKLLDTIIAGLQDQKARRIVVADLKKTDNTLCSYLVICEGTSNTHVNAVATNLKDFVRENVKVKPLAMEGFENCEWIVADYNDVMVHIMQRPAREFYDLEHLWADAKLKEIPDLD
ncbi:MAG: ribosome silencing factor [Paludibacteraceae bacterium]|nr:ribosome silencing factor [Paludibacteraceae bacterium]